MEIDITELLENQVALLEKTGVSRESIESKLMLEAKEEIEKLRKNLIFQIEESVRSNDSRLKYMDFLHNAMELYEETCKNVRDCTGEDYVCGMCKWDCDTSIGPSGDHMSECPGFEKDDCFELDTNKFRKIVFNVGESENG